VTKRHILCFPQSCFLSCYNSLQVPLKLAIFSSVLQAPSPILCDRINSIKNLSCWVLLLGNKTFKRSRCQKRQWNTKLKRKSFIRTYWNLPTMKLLKNYRTFLVRRTRICPYFHRQTKQSTNPCKKVTSLEDGI